MTYTRRMTKPLTLTAAQQARLSAYAASKGMTERQVLDGFISTLPAPKKPVAKAARPAAKRDPEALTAAERTSLAQARKEAREGKTIKGKTVFERYGL